MIGVEHGYSGLVVYASPSRPRETSQLSTSVRNTTNIANQIPLFLLSSCLIFLIALFLIEPGRPILNSKKQQP